MTQFPSRCFSWSARLALAAAVLFAGAACSNSSSSPTSPGTPPGSGCQIITGITTTTFAAAGGAASISVSTTAACAWTAVSSATFLTVTQGASGSGDGLVQFSVAANAGVQRTVILTITGTPITITQLAQ